MSAPHTGPIRLAVRTHPFHGCDTSSILVWVATSPSESHWEKGQKMTLLDTLRQFRRYKVTSLARVPGHENPPSNKRFRKSELAG